MDPTGSPEAAATDALLLRILAAVARRTGDLQYAKAITADAYRAASTGPEGATPGFGSMLATALGAATKVANDMDEAAAYTATDAGVIASLRPSDRQILRLVYWDHVSMAELADYLGCSIADAGRRLDRAYRLAERRLRRMASRTETAHLPAVKPQR
jgi:Sigma-70, region 4